MENNKTTVRARPVVVPERVRAVLAMLLRAADLAKDAATDRWQFALEINDLKQCLDRTDLRWSVIKGLIHHRRETTRITDAERTFLAKDSLKFSKRSCFVLTDMGIEVARRLADESGDFVGPRWDGLRHELWLGDNLVKRFKLPSPNQETILAAFEEEKWPPRIDDPLPKHPDIDPKNRLHDAIKGLNRNQKSHVLRFHGDGSGQGIRWEADTRQEE